MNKLKLFISVGICGILFTGCGFFGTRQQVERGSDCVPADLMDRLVKYSSRGNVIYTKAFDNYFKDIVDESKCDEWGIEHYKEIVSKEKYLPIYWEAEQRLQKKWDICNAMPKWLESKLNEYIEQNKNDDKAYIEASKFKESWQTDDRFNGKATYFTVTVVYRDGEFDKARVTQKITCKAIKIATKAIENDLIDLGNGEKAKCADLSYKDAKKCQSHFDSVYKKAKADYELKQQRIEYEKKNKK